jgi:catechol 2,3-dioxygenase-like lactoylglutathione lyase family enzyme
VVFDAPVGVPTTYLQAYIARFGPLDSFADWLEDACRRDDLFVPVRRPEDWAVERPFFHVPPGKGSLTAFVRAAEGHGVDLKREVERRTHAKSVFAMGIPGHVAHTAQALWKELAAERGRGRRFTLWPFEDSASGGPAVAEIYPRVAYAVVVAGGLRGAKRQQVVRREFIDKLLRTSWVGDGDLTFEALDQARSNEDDFDAFVTAVALLRLVVDGLPLVTQVDSVAEGAVLAEAGPSETEPVMSPPVHQHGLAPLPARISFVTLACQDMERMTRFYRQFGWPEAPSSEPVHVVFQCTNGVVLGLYGAEHYLPHVGPAAEGFRGYTLAINCADLAEVERVHEAVSALEDVHELENPQAASWGGGFSFRDPEGNIWDVAWADGSRFDERGGLIFP